MKQNRLTSEFLDSTLCPLNRDFTLDKNLQKPRKCRIRKFPKAGLGSLGIFPNEILYIILSKLDLRSLTDFQWVNKLARQLVASFPQYKAITTQAPECLGGILAIESGRWITCTLLYQALCTANCETCGDFAGYIFILTCRRVCFLCFAGNESFQPLPYARAIKKFGLNRLFLDTVPHMKSVPGTYTPWLKVRHQRLLLVDHDSARLAGIALHGSVAAMERHVSHKIDQKLQRYEERLLQRRRISSGPATRRPRTEELFDLKETNVFRFMAIIRVERFNPISQEMEAGRHCLGCRDEHDREKIPRLDWRRQFTEASFARHLEECGRILNGEHQRI